MSDFHYIEDRVLLRVVRRAIRTAKADGVDPEGAALAAVTEWLLRQRTAPDLIGANVAAEMLGVQTPHLARLRRQERLPEPIPVEGTHPGYIREEIAALAMELETEREQRAARGQEES